MAEHGFAPLLFGTGLCFLAIAFLLWRGILRPPRKWRRGLELTILVVLGVMNLVWGVAILVSPGRP
jgi:hypothetical protein